MSVKIHNNVISLTRGDSLFTKISIKNSDGTDYIPTEDDVIKFGMKKTINDAECLIEKVIPNDTLELHLLPEDTKQLPYGDYVYDMQIEFAGGEVYTFITYTKFTITGEVV